MTPCTFCITDKNGKTKGELITTWKDEDRAGLEYLLQSKMVECDIHKLQVEARLKEMPKVYKLKQGPVPVPASFMPKPAIVAVRRHWTDERPENDGSMIE